MSVNIIDYHRYFLSLFMHATRLWLFFIVVAQTSISSDWHESIKHNVGKLSENDKALVYEIFNNSYCFSKNVDSDVLSNILIVNQPKKYNPDTITPSYAKKILQLKKWRDAMEIFAQAELCLMPEDIYDAHLKNASECAMRIRNTPSFLWHKGHGIMLKLLAGKKQRLMAQTYAWGLQNCHRDSVALAGGCLSVVVGSLAARFFIIHPHINQQESAIKQWLTDILHSSEDVYRPVVVDMQQEGCGYGYFQEIKTNYFIDNGALTKYPNTSNVTQEFCTTMADAIKDFINSPDRCFRPTPPVIDTDMNNFIGSCITSMERNLSSSIEKQESYSHLYIFATHKGPNLPHKGIFSLLNRLSIPDNFPKSPSEIGFLYDVVNPSCYVKKSLEQKFFLPYSLTLLNIIDCCLFYLVVTCLF